MAKHPERSPHRDQLQLTHGESLADADLVIILVHGRGDSAAGILSLAEWLPHPKATYLAPQAFRNTWYPFSFLMPRKQNEPGISSGLAVLNDLVADVEGHGIPAERIVLGGFSQGACLTSDFVARHPRRYGGVLIFSGGLIGAPGEIPHYAGDLADTPVFVGCSDVDPHIPVARVKETAALFRDLGGDVTERIYPGAGHTILPNEISIAANLIANVV